MKGYKGFNPDFTCRGKQYLENTIFEEETAEICKSGMHFCPNPFDVLEHYPFVNDDATINEFAEVEALDEVKTDDNKKYTTKKLKVGAKIGIPGLVNAFVDYTIEKTDKGNTDKCDEDYSAATNTGNRSAATNTGDYSAASVSGKNSFAFATGVDCKAKGEIGCYISLAEWIYNSCEYELVDFKTVKVDGVIIKANTFYKLVNGKFTECEG